MNVLGTRDVKQATEAWNGTLADPHEFHVGISHAVGNLPSGWGIRAKKPVGHETRYFDTRRAYGGTDAARCSQMRREVFACELVYLPVGACVRPTVRVRVARVPSVCAS